MRIFGITGFKNSGKTHLVVALVRHFAAQGMRVATLKHAHHGFDMDQPGKDSWQHREAGAAEVLVASRRRIAHLEELGDAPEPSLPELLSRLRGPELVIVEGFKASIHPRLQVVRDANDRILDDGDGRLRAVVSDLALTGLAVPRLPRDDLDRIAALVAADAAPVEAIAARARLL